MSEESRKSVWVSESKAKCPQITAEGEEGEGTDWKKWKPNHGLTALLAFLRTGFNYEHVIPTQRPEARLSQVN